MIDILDDPETNNSKVAKQLNVSNKIVWRILKTYFLYYFHIQGV